MAGAEKTDGWMDEMGPGMMKEAAKTARSDGWMERGWKGEDGF